MLTRKKWYMLVAVLIFIVIGLLVQKYASSPALPMMTTPIGSFTMEDLSLLERSSGQSFSIGLHKEDVQTQFPHHMKYINKGQLEFMYDYNDQVGYINALPEHNKFVTARGIRIGDKQSKVLERYGAGTYETDLLGTSATAYAMFKEGEVLTFIKDSESLAEADDEYSIYVLYFFWAGDKHPKVQSIMIGKYSESLKDPEAESIKRIKESVLNIPETAQEIVSLYDRYLEGAIVGHIQFENYQINFERYQQLDKLAVQIIRNLMNGFAKNDDELYPPKFKEAMLDFMDEGIRLIQERSREERNADKSTNHQITVTLKQYRDRFGELARQFDCEISDDSFIDVQIHH